MRPINTDSVVLGSVHKEEHPHYKSAYILYAQWASGSALTGEEMDRVKDERPELIQELAREQSNG